MELVKPLAVHSALEAPLTDDQKLLLEGGLPSKRLHWCMPLPCVAMIHFTDYQSFLQLCLLTFDQRFPFNTRKICRERERKKEHYGEINGSPVSGGLGFMARGASLGGCPGVLPSECVLWHFMKHGLYQHGLL